ncbi:MAG: hypothetical protein V2J26_07655 [Pacificimonas sp.]|jgi:hypothetical protein|nr:hypothetical protein [Pacificimonas sp.]
MGPLLIILLGALAVFWWLGLLTPERGRLILGLGAAALGLFLAVKNPVLGAPVMALGGYLLWSGTRPKIEDGQMTLAEARALLGVSDSAPEKDIRAAHRLAVSASHPDRGGSGEETARLNEARDLLLKQKPRK